MVTHDRARRRSSAGPSGPVRSNSKKNIDGFTDVATRRRSAGGGAEPTPEAFDPFATSSKSKKKVSDDVFGSSDPFAVDATTGGGGGGTKKKKDVPLRQAPPRSASIGAISKSDLEDFQKSSEFKDSDLMFDDVDWDGTAAARFQSAPRPRPKSTSRRHSMDSAPNMLKSAKAPDFEPVNEEDDGFGQIIKASTSGGGEGDKNKKDPKRNTKSRSRRQSLDSALTQQDDEDDADGFGEVKTYGFADGGGGGGGGEQRSARRGSVGRSRASEGVQMVSAPRRVVHRRRSGANMKQMTDSANEYESETTATNTTNGSNESDALGHRVDTV